MLKGDRVRLRAVEPADYELIWSWLNDPDVMYFWGRSGNTQSLREVTVEETVQAERPNSRKYIIETNEGQPIGQCDYYDLDWRTRSAWVSILIGDPAFWGGGYGTEALRLLLRYLFRELGMHRVALNVHAGNVRAQRSYAKNGFKTEGIMRDWAFFNGTWMDGILMSVLESEFQALDS